MGATDDVEVVRRGYAAFSAGDMATLNELFTDDAVWHVPGTGTLSGSKQGRDAILSFFGQLMSQSGGTLKVMLDDVVGGDDHTVAMSRNQAARDTRTLDQQAVIVFTLRDGRVTEARQFFDDTALNDAFWD
jgi:ketosteroid isomerase-like protein